MNITQEECLAVTRPWTPCQSFPATSVGFLYTCKAYTTTHVPYMYTTNTCTVGIFFNVG